MLLSVSNIRKTILYCKRNGFKSSVYATMERIEQRKQAPYVYDEPSSEELEYQEAERFDYEPLISVVVPCYETKPVFLEDLILSLEDQSYKNFELVLADASTSNIVFKTASELMEVYGDNIVYKKIEKNLGISENTNQALDFAQGDYIALLDHDDVLTPDALYEMVKTINILKSKDIDPVLIYSDEDKADGYLDSFYEPNLKPKFNLDLIMTNNYICHLSLFRADVIKKLGLRKKYDGAQDYDLVLRTILYIKDNYGNDYDKYIHHVPKVLYHWRCHDESTAANPASKDYAYENGRLALKAFVDAMGWSAKVSHLKHVGFYKVSYENGIMAQRDDVGVVGAPIYHNNKICGGAMNGKGKVLYKDLRKGYSGYLHRAVLKQQVDVVDIRNMKISEKLIPLFEKVTGMSYYAVLNKQNQISDEDAIKHSINFCNKVKAKKIKIVYDPEETQLEI